MLYRGITQGVSIHWECSDKMESGEIFNRILSCRFKKITISIDNYKTKNINFLKDIVLKLKSINNIVLNLEINNFAELDVKDLKEYFNNIRLIYRSFETINRANILKSFNGLIEKLDIQLYIDINNYHELQNIIKDIHFDTNLFISLAHYVDAKSIISEEKLSDVIFEINKVLNTNNNKSKIKLIDPTQQIKNNKSYVSDKSLIENIYLSSDGNIGSFSFLPTYGQSIYNGDLYDEAEQYYNIYFKQDIGFLLSQKRILTKLTNLDEFKNGSKLFSYYNNYVPNINKSSSLIEGDNNCIYIKNQINSAMLEIDTVEDLIFRTIDGVKSIIEINDEVSGNLPELDKDRLFCKILLLLERLERKNYINISRKEG